MTTCLPALLAILAISLIALFTSTVSAEEVRKLTNDNVVPYEQPCYNRATTTEVGFGDVPTWCDVQPDLIMCTSDVEPTYCSE